MSLFASQRIRNRFEDVNEQARRALNGTSAAVNHARHAARPAVEDVQSLLHSLEDAIEALADEGSAEASRARRTLRAGFTTVRNLGLFVKTGGYLLDVALGKAMAASRLSLTGSRLSAKDSTANLRALEISSSARRRVFSASALARK